MILVLWPPSLPAVESPNIEINYTMSEKEQFT